MSRNRNRFPRLNNSGKFRQPTNVWIYFPSDSTIVQSVYLESELQDLAVDFPDWIIFVKEN